MEFKFEPLEITKELLLSKHSQETYMEHYLGIRVRKGLLRSPLRDDPNPTCSFYVNSHQDLIFKDFRGDFHGNFINVVMYKYRVNYHKALQIIANDFGIIERKEVTKNERLIEYSNEKFKYSGECVIQVQIKPFSKQELKWWASFGITEEILKKFNVFSCKTVFLNGQVFTTSSLNDPIYGYYRAGKDDFEYWRIYFPFRKTYRFLSNWKSNMIQGGQQFQEYDHVEYCAVTKSLKDVMCLYSLGEASIAPNSETIFLTDTQLEYVNSKSDYTCLFYDNDLAGIMNMNKIRKIHEIPCLWIPKKYQVKDISDFYVEYGRDKTLEIINNAKLWLNGQQKLL